jgi:hypothetical protein
MVYGVYESQDDAENAPAEAFNNLQQNVPLRIDMHGNRVVFLGPRTGPATTLVTRSSVSWVRDSQNIGRGKLAARASLTRRMKGS